jgi:mono/diheme cytochrome c family protein
MVPRRIVFALGAVLGCGLLLGAGQQSTNAPKDATKDPTKDLTAESPKESPREVTYNRDVAPILYKNCVTCHRPNDIAPMSLMTYKNARPWARMIREAVVQRKMPPWHADPKVGDFMNDPRLSDADIATIDAWVRTGAKEGDAKDLPAAPVFAENWHIQPDVVFTIPEFTVAGASQDD